MADGRPGNAQHVEAGLRQASKAGSGEHGTQAAVERGSLAAPAVRHIHNVNQQ